MTSHIQPKSIPLQIQRRKETEINFEFRITWIFEENSNVQMIMDDQFDSNVKV